MCLGLNFRWVFEDYLLCHNIPKLCRWYLGFSVRYMLSLTKVAMAVGEFQSTGCTMYLRAVSPSQFPPFMVVPELALFLAIDFDCFL